MANYWQISRNDLPSRFFFYSEKASIKCRLLNIQELKYLSTISPESGTDIVNEILQRCLKLDNIEYEELLLADREWLCFWLRTNSFLNGASYTISKSECRRCKKPIEHEIQLADMNVVMAEHIPGPCVLPDTGFMIEMHYPTVKDLKINYKEMPEIEFAARCISGMKDPVQFILNLSAMDYAALMEEAEYYNIGFNKKITFYCKDPMCNAEHQALLVLPDDGLFGKIDIGNIIEQCTRVEKYLAVPISDETPWMEMELKFKVVEKMIKEENDEAEKQQRKANAQAAAAKSRASSSSHSHR